MNILFLLCACVLEPVALTCLPNRNCPCLISYPLLVELEPGCPSPPLSPSTLAPLKSEQTLKAQCPHWADLSKTCFLAESFPTAAMCYCHPLLAHIFSFLKKNSSVFFFFGHLFTCAYIVWVISPPCPTPPPFSLPSQFQAGPVLPLSLILLKKRHMHNKEDKAVLLVELRIAIQKDSYCFCVPMCYDPCWFNSNWSLHWFLIPCSW
jgi:hypothetical protein